MTTDIRLRRSGDGRYETQDGRFTVTRTTMGQGVNNNGGWSPGRTAWDIEDTTGRPTFSYSSPFAPRPTKTVDTLWEARDLIAWAYSRETAR